MKQTPLKYYGKYAPNLHILYLLIDYKLRMLLTLNDKEYLIPQKWTQVSLGSYQAFMDITSDDLDEHTNNMNAISSLVGVPMQTLEKCKKNDIDSVVNVLGELLNVKVNTTLNLIIEVDGKKYGFHPNLKDITFGEFVDLDNYLEKPLENLHKIMAVLYREITHEKKDKYDIVEYDGTRCSQNAKLFKDKLSIATVNGAVSFFLNIGKEYLVIMQSSLKAQMKSKQITEIQMNNLVKSGVGTV